MGPESHGGWWQNQNLCPGSYRFLYFLTAQGSLILMVWEEKLRQVSTGWSRNLVFEKPVTHQKPELHLLGPGCESALSSLSFVCLLRRGCHPFQAHREKGRVSVAPGPVGWANAGTYCCPSSGWWISLLWVRAPQ